MLPSSEPCFVYAVDPVPHEMPEIHDDTFGDHAIDSAFPETYERAAVEFILAAGFYDEDLNDISPEYEFMSCNWGIIDRWLGPWIRRRTFGEGFREFRDDWRMSHGTREMCRALFMHIFMPARDRAFHKIRAALRRLIDAGYIKKYRKNVEDFGSMTFYAPMPKLIECLSKNA